MKLFYGEIIPDVIIHEDEQQHMVKVLRMRDGESIHITDGKGNVAHGKLLIEGKKASVINYTIEQYPSPYIPKLHIAIAPTKNIDRIEFFVEKAIEMGISEITFLHCDNSERKNINDEKILKQAIAASKQSLRFHFPTINPLVKLSDFLKNIDPSKTFIAHCDESFTRTTITDLPTLDEYTFLVGPEGDFSKREIQVLSDLNIKAVSLGNQRLRTETAGIFISAYLYSTYK